MDAGITTRKAGQQDREALCEIHVAAIRGVGTSHYSRADIDAWSSGRTPERYARHIAERHVIVAQCGSDPVGFGTLDCATGELLQLYVRPEHARKRGIYPAVKWSDTAFEDTKYDFVHRDDLESADAPFLVLLGSFVAFPLWCCDCAVSACTDTLLLPFDLAAQGGESE